jgi:glycosyltransferase involved in cell wall biosynthesis
VARALQALGTVELVVVKLADDDDGTSTDPTDEVLRVSRVVTLQPLGPRSVWGRIRCGFDSRFIGHYGHDVASQDRAAVLGDLPSYDLIWLHNTRTADVFGQWRWPRSVMDIDDLPSSLVRAERDHSRGLRERLRAEVRLRVATRRERRFGDRFTTLAVCSEADRAYLGLDRKVHVIPNGFARPATEPLRRPARPARIGFIGIFGYTPNSEAVAWFIEECWPRIKIHVPDARLRLVGAGSDRCVSRSGRDIDALGWVDDAAAEIDTWSTMIVPLRSGSGSRVKIAEGFSRKCPIVSTTLGAYGYGCTDGRELFLADSAEDFANACIRTVHEPAEAAAMAERAWRVFLDNWTWEAIRPRVWEAAEDCLRSCGAGTGGLWSDDAAFIADAGSPSR